MFHLWHVLEHKHFFLQALMEFNLLNVIFHHLADPTGRTVGLLYVSRLHFSELILGAGGCLWKISCVFFLGSSSYICLPNNLFSFLCFSFPVWYWVLYQWARTSLWPACYTFIRKGDFRKNGNCFYITISSQCQATSGELGLAPVTQIWLPMKEFVVSL